MKMPYRCYKTNYRQILQEETTIKLTYLLTFLLTYLLTELSPCWAAANFAAAHELSRILWDPKFHYRVHKIPPLVPILSQIDPVHNILSYLFKIYFNSQPTYVLVFLVVSFLLAFPLISYMYSSSPYSSYMPCPPHPPWFYHSNYVWRGVQVYSKTEDVNIYWNNRNTTEMKEKRKVRNWRKQA
jgi:hypothetical protein